MTRLITQQERRLTAAKFQQLGEVLAAIEWFANFEIRADGFGSLPADHANNPCWSNPTQMTSEVECKWVSKSVQSPSRQTRHLRLAHGSFGM